MTYGEYMYFAIHINFHEYIELALGFGSIIFWIRKKKIDMKFNHEDHIITNQKDTVKQYKITTKTTPITMSSFTIRTDRKQKSNRRRVGGRGRRPRPTGQQGHSIGAF